MFRTCYHMNKLMLPFIRAGTILHVPSRSDTLSRYLRCDMIYITIHCNSIKTGKRVLNLFNLSTFSDNILNEHCTIGK